MIKIMQSNILQAVVDIFQCLISLEFFLQNDLIEPVGR